MSRRAAQPADGLRQVRLIRESSGMCIIERRVKMFQRILVPLDGSALAEQALPVAARIARAGGGIITLLHVANVSTTAVSYGAMQPLITQDAIDISLEHGNAYL